MEQTERRLLEGQCCSSRGSVGSPPESEEQASERESSSQRNSAAKLKARTKKTREKARRHAKKSETNNNRLVDEMERAADCNSEEVEELLFRSDSPSNLSNDGDIQTGRHGL